MPRTVHVVPHTHWDREWYRPYQTFRMQLVDLLDGLLPAMAADPAYAHFMLDGQMAVVDDYLALRPEAEPVLRRLAAAGRITMGPWYILMDEFLVSGETMIRDLQLGLDRAARFGGAMQVGYLPDMFGHVAQMPQLLAQFGFDDTVVWRGVPQAIDSPAFWWEAPDGSRVRAAYLASGYSNGSVLPGDAKELVAQIDGWCREQGDRAGDPVLWMNGTDHLLPQAHLGRVVAEANGLQDDYQLEVTSLAHHLTVAADHDGDLPVWTGELRSGARANLLMGVASNRVDVHQAEMRTTRALEQIAEPLSALYLPADRWPARFLDAAWLEVIRNSAHDSICACSVDEVGRAVIHRFDEARTIAEGLIDRAVAAIAEAVGGDLPIAVNPAARPRSGLIELTVPGEQPPEGAQVVSVRPGRRVLTAEARTGVESITTTAMATLGADLEGVVVDERDGVLLVELYIDGTTAPPDAHVEPGDAARAVHDAIAAAPEGMARVEVITRPRQRVLTRLTGVPGFGWARCHAEPLDVDPVTPVRTTGMTNGLVEVVVDEADGTWSLGGRPGYGRLVDDGDVGDTYNYCPPAADTVVDRPDAIAIEVQEAGPLRGRIAIVASYTWPERADAGSRTGERPVEVRTLLELRAGEDLLRVRHELDNPCEDHLRAWFPLPQPASTSRAETAFGTVDRGLVAEGGPNELGLPTFPSRRFVQAGGLTVAHDGLLEYELVDVAGDGARQLALTLLRCTGLISQGPMAYRSVPAGPQIETADAQMRGRHVLEYVLTTSGRDPFAVADDAFVPLIRARSRRGVAGMAGLATITPPIAPGAVDPSADRGSPLTLTGAEVSAVTRADGRLSVRVFNPTDRATTVTIDGRHGWLVDLRGRTLEPFEGSFELRPHGIATAVLDD